MAAAKYVVALVAERAVERAVAAMGKAATARTAAARLAASSHLPERKSEQSGQGMRAHEQRHRGERSRRSERTSKARGRGRRGCAHVGGELAEQERRAPYESGDPLGAIWPSEWASGLRPSHRTRCIRSSCSSRLLRWSTRGSERRPCPRDSRLIFPRATASKGQRPCSGDHRMRRPPCHLRPEAARD